VVLLELLLFITTLKKLKRKTMKNPKTTLFGLLAAIGGYFATSTTGTLQTVGQIIGSVFTFLTGAAAQDGK
jgi:hypothetical protein